MRAVLLLAWLRRFRPHLERNLESEISEVVAVAGALGIGLFGVLGDSGGGPHALARAALLPERVSAAVRTSGPAPVDAEGLDWFAGWSGGHRSGGEPGRLIVTVAVRLGN